MKYLNIKFISLQSLEISKRFEYIDIKCSQIVPIKRSVNELIKLKQSAGLTHNIVSWGSPKKAPGSR